MQKWILLCSIRYSTGVQLCKNIEPRKPKSLLRLPKCMEEQNCEGIEILASTYMNQYDRYLQITPSGST